MKGSNADPYVADVALPNVELGDYSVPTDWPTNVKFNAPGDVPGPVVQFEDDDQSDVKAGYGFESDNLYDGDWFFFHTDHLGSTSYLTDTAGNVSQFVCYTPYGEAIVDEHLTTYENPFKFSGKELDDITGLYDHGARSRNPISTLWYGIDPLWEKYPEMSPFAYCHGNPVRLTDPTGMFDTEEEVLAFCDVNNITAQYQIQGDGTYVLTDVDDGTKYTHDAEGILNVELPGVDVIAKAPEKKTEDKPSALDVAGKVLTPTTGVMAFQDAAIGFSGKALEKAEREAAARAAKAAGATSKAATSAAKTVDAGSKIVKGLGYTSTVVGTAGSVVTIIGGYQNYHNGRTARGVTDMVVGGVGVATPILVGLGLVSNPVGWAIGIGCGVYGISTLIYDAATGQ